MPFSRRVLRLSEHIRPWTKITKPTLWLTYLSVSYWHQCLNPCKMPVFRMLIFKVSSVRIFLLLFGRGLFKVIPSNKKNKNSTNFRTNKFTRLYKGENSFKVLRVSSLVSVSWKRIYTVNSFGVIWRINGHEIQTRKLSRQYII